jgi:hypothetical protein
MARKYFSAGYLNVMQNQIRINDLAFSSQAMVFFERQCNDL